MKKEGKEKKKGEGRMAGRASPAAAGDGRKWPEMAGSGRSWPELAGEGGQGSKPKSSSGVQVYLIWKIWSFTKGITESKAIARRKEHDEERKMAWSLVVKVEYVVVEMVEKVVVEMGYFGG